MKDKERTKEEKGLNYYRQTKSFGYKQPVGHKTTKSMYKFSKEGQIDLLHQYEKDTLSPTAFVATIIP